MRKLFVSGFPLEITEMELAVLIAPHGDINTIKIVRDKKTGKCKGYAFVEMATAEGATRAAGELDGLNIKDRELTVNINPDTPEQKGALASPVTNSQPVKLVEEARISSRIVKAEIEKPKRPRRPRL
ncbi:RNA-binding protein [Mucilaginibacter achroorhodeus]|uniref:RNA-binding protein n=1 Tax=Mucilaginibacter achroorhodeus TaxID=2599294 RepID=A0A563U621_9SPHI|nr:RNA-binding protein [Mucilaginibacter achroorhodeus]TWR26800.1 RNA-binding protein [Mucilaginibacter achroorhodeus]